MSREMNHRAVLAGTAAIVPVAAVGAVPALTAEPDPAFTAIEAHRRAWVSLDDVVGKHSKLEKDLPAERRRSRITAWEETIAEDDDPRWIEAERAVARAHDTTGEAEDQFILNQPTTIAGVAALLRYVGEHDAKTGDDLCDSSSQFQNDAGAVFDFHEAFRLTLADALERIVAGKPIEPGRLKKCLIEDEPEEKVAEEPAKQPTPWTLDETAASYRRVIDHCMAKLSEIEAQIAAA